ncbi:MAG: amidohydrolase family protein [Deltaproteobacteria bacterium]|jgi:N-acyl-D-aspartate/D-glutamate deacylase|nr:amidohydrolase family protein [Deltaproteobacteria bacterium]
MKTLLRGGELVDGTGAPPRRADVLLEDGSVLAVGELGRSDRMGASEVACDGLVIAPGFIDVHTHYDAQVFWDPDLTPSSWHGITTVVMGNCGFGIAPTRRKDRPTVARILENVEGMTLEALEAGIPWGFESFPEYLSAVGALPLRLNVAAFVGHTPVRQYVMGEDSTERAATPAEVASMRQIVGDAMDAGAIGFSTSHAASHVGAHGRPVPSRASELSEIWELAGALGERGVGVVEATWGPDLFVEEFARLARDIGRPVSWAAIMATRRDPEYAPGVIARTHEFGGEVRPQIAGRPIVVQITLMEPGPFGNVPSFVEVLALAAEARPPKYRDPAWRARAEDEIREAWGDIVDRTRVSESRCHRELVGGDDLGTLARSRGTTAFQLMIDLALEEDLETRFHVPMTNDDEEQIARMLNDERLLLGLSDAGAHTSQLCDADFATYLLQHWWREERVITLEKAIWRLTGQPAEFLGLEGRGRLAPGAAADVVAFDPRSVGTQPLERVHDLPTGADRLIARSTGIEHVWVGGMAIRQGGQDLSRSESGAPGRVLRPGPRAH